MRILIVLCLSLLSACTYFMPEKSSTWINQEAIDAALHNPNLREALLSKGPNLEWKLDPNNHTAQFSDGFEQAEGQLSTSDKGLWQVAFYQEGTETLRQQGKILEQVESSNWPAQSFVRVKSDDLPLGESFERAINKAYFGGAWLIQDGPNTGGKVIFQPDGQVSGLDEVSNYSLCLAGDCAATAGNYNVILLENHSEDSQAWIIERSNDQLEIFSALNKAGDDSSIQKGTRRWLLTRIPSA